MFELCPACAKNGYQNKIRAVQLNYHEAVWLCESKNCIWPFAYEDFQIFKRKIGEAMSYNWQMYKPVQSRYNAPVTPDFSMYTPPDTPGRDTSCKEMTVKSPVAVDVNDTNNIYTNINSTESANEASESMCPSDIKVKTKGIPRIRSIQKTKVGGLKYGKSSVSIKKESLIQNLDEAMSDGIPTKVETDLVSSKSENNIEVRTMHFDGLPPVTVKFEMEENLGAKRNNLSDNRLPAQTNYNAKFVITKSVTSKCKDAKKYEKFSFDKIRNEKKEVDEKKYEPEVIEISDDDDHDTSKPIVDNPQDSIKDTKPPISDSNIKTQEISLEELLLEGLPPEQCPTLTDDIDMSFMDSFFV